MRNLVLVIFLVLPSFVFAQANTSLSIEPYFNAIIVQDMDASIEWYTNILGFEVINNVSSEERGFKQSNLKREGIWLELIELNGAITPAEIIPNYTTKTKIIGFFKTGFLVSDFDDWIKHLEEGNVMFQGNIVTDETTGKKMIIILDPDGNRIQLFEK